MQKVIPYKSVKLEWLAKECNTTVRDVKQLISELIIDGKIDGQIDQISGYLELNEEDTHLQKHTALSQWADTLHGIHTTLTQGMN